jgi:uncharacterized MnhB-related membrane protein
MTTTIELILLLFLILCALFCSIARSLLSSVVIFMSYSLVMSVVWVFLQSPDLAITEAAVGAGVTSLLFFLTLKKIHAIDIDVGKEDDDHEPPTR